MSGLVQSASVALDGDLSDLMSAIAGNPYAPYNGASGTDPDNDAEQNGFDITNTYSYYDMSSDTFFLGMSFLGDVGTSGGMEGTFSNWCTQPAGGFNYGIAGTFDACESYGIGIDINNDGSFELDIRLQGDALADSGIGTEHIVSETNDNSVSVNWAISESFNGVEFSVTGFENLLNPMSKENPRDVLINFYAGSTSNLGPEDLASLNMQVVPIPAAVWLFASGLVGLIGLARRKGVSK